MITHPSRREFISSSARAAAWLTLSSGALASLASCARDDARRDVALTTLSPEEGRAMRAFAARIVPSVDGLPGAEEAGAVHFIDRAVGEFMPPLHGAVTGATQALDEAAGTGVTFAELDAEGQDEILRASQGEGWFGALRMLALAAVFSGESYGGGLERAGLAVADIEHEPAYQPPFGAYDTGYESDDGGAA